MVTPTPASTSRSPVVRLLTPQRDVGVMPVFSQLSCPWLPPSPKCECTCPWRRRPVAVPLRLMPTYCCASVDKRGLSRVRGHTVRDIALLHQAPGSSKEGSGSAPTRRRGVLYNPVEGGL